MNSVVSVIIVTYNSSEFIIETLESVKWQTYQNIELIITDDASADNTVVLCKRWLSENKSRFVRTKLITAAKNSGIVANRNRGLSSTEGEWIKFCAGDDALLPNCIEDNLEYIKEHPEIEVLFSYCRMYNNQLSEEFFVGLNPRQYPSHIISELLTAEDQHKLLLVDNRIPFAPSVFLSYKVLIKYNDWDESYPFTEDLQTWIEFTKNGIRLFFMERETVKYRAHHQSLSRQKDDLVLNPMYFKSISFAKNKVYPFYPWDLKLSKLFSCYVNQIFRFGFFNKKTMINISLYYLLNRILNPFQYFVYYKSKYSKRHKNNFFYTTPGGVLKNRKANIG